MSKDLKKGQSTGINVDYAPIITSIKESPFFYRYTGSLTTPVRNLDDRLD